MANDTESKSDWHKIWFQHAHSDSRWAKEQGWKVSQWTVVLIAGLVAAGRQLTTVPVEVWFMALVLIEAFAIWYLLDLHRFGKTSRDTSERLLKKPDELKAWREDLLPKREKDPHHYTHLVARIVVVVAAGVIGAAVVWAAYHTTPTIPGP